MAQSKAFQDHKRNTKPSSLALGDAVLVRQQKWNKLTPYYDPKPYKIIAVKGSMVIASKNGQNIVRNSSFFKKIPPASVHSPVPERKSAILPAPPTAVFCFPPSSSGGQQGVRDLPVPVLPRPVLPPPVLPDPFLPVPDNPNNPFPHDSDDEFVDEEEPVPEQNNAPDPGQAAIARDAAAIGPAAHRPPIAVFHPQANVPLAQETFELPRDIRPNPYNLRDCNPRN